MPEIKREIKSIISNLESSTFGLQEIKSEVQSIMNLLQSPTFGLAEAKSEIQSILNLQLPEILTTGVVERSSALASVLDVSLNNRSGALQTINIKLFDWLTSKALVTSRSIPLPADQGTIAFFGSVLSALSLFEVQIGPTPPGVYVYVGVNNEFVQEPANSFKHAELVPAINPDPLT